MSQIKKTLGCMAVAQAVCLALGLWVQDRIVVASAEWMIENDSQTAVESSEPISSDETTQSDATSSLTAGALLSSMPSARIITFVWIFGLQAVVGYLILSRVHNEHSQKQMQSNEDSINRVKDLVRTRDAVIFGLAKLAESRDPDTGHHLERIASYSTRIASVLCRHPEFSKHVTPSFVRMIGVSSALHDIGKVGVEDSILLKPGKLNDQERFLMQLHVTVGAECISQIEKRLGNTNFLQMAREIALCHHERWDGKGYPRGLQGREIPLAARIVSIADVYDALSVRRVYKEAFPHEKCVKIISEEAGKQFDPELVKVFLSIESEFRAIAKQFSDEESEGRLLETVDTIDSTESRMSPSQERIINAVVDTNKTTAAAEHEKHADVAESKTKQQSREHIGTWQLN